MCIANVGRYIFLAYDQFVDLPLSALGTEKRYGAGVFMQANASAATKPVCIIQQPRHRSSCSSWDGRLGTDDIGYDTWTRCEHGAHLNLVICFSLNPPLNDAALLPPLTF